MKRKSKYTLDELLAKCDSSTSLPEEDKEWLNMIPVGNEVIPEEERVVAVKTALHSLALEGLTPSENVLLKFGEYLDGKISMEELSNYVHDNYAED